LLKSIATQVNTIQMTGFDQNGVAAAEEIFLPAAPGVGLEIFNYTVNAAVLADPTLIAAADGAAFLGSGDGSNALAMAQLQNTDMAALGNDTFIGYFNTQASNLGIDKNTHDDRASNTDDILNSLVENRQRESGVNMEEEMVDLLRFQRSFEASSRVIRTIDQMMQTILQMVS
jgi:flagellar hook-associated protein 1 FlgK